MERTQIQHNCSASIRNVETSKDKYELHVVSKLLKIKALYTNLCKWAVNWMCIQREQEPWIISEPYQIVVTLERYNNE